MRVRAIHLRIDEVELARRSFALASAAATARVDNGGAAMHIRG